MSRVTAAFVCALCDPDNPRPASIMCSNNCGRYVCAVHAVPRKGPGSAMICQACAEALGLIDKPKPRPAPEVRPLIEIPSEPAARPEPQTSTSTVQAEPFVAPAIAEPTLETKSEPVKPVVETAATAAVVSASVQEEAPPLAEQVTIVTPPIAPPPPRESVVIDNTGPIEPRSAVRLTDTEPAPKSAASETVVSQRGNTLQVPKVSPALGKPPQPIAPKPRKAQRTDGASAGGNLDWRMIGMVAGTVVLGVVGFVMILAALAG
jgi:hypothetical protein